MQDIDIVVHLTSCCQWIVCLVLFPDFWFSNIPRYLCFTSDEFNRVLHEYFDRKCLQRREITRGLSYGCSLAFEGRCDAFLFDKRLPQSIWSNLKTSNVLYLTWFIDTLLNFILIYKQNILTCRTNDWMRI